MTVLCQFVHQAMIVLQKSVLIGIPNVATVFSVLGNNNVAQDLEERLNKKFEHYENEIRSLKKSVKEQASQLVSTVTPRPRRASPKQRVLATATTQQTEQRRHRNGSSLIY